MPNFHLTETKIIVAGLNNLLFHTKEYQINKVLEQLITKYSKYTYDDIRLLLTG